MKKIVTKSKLKDRNQNIKKTRFPPDSLDRDHPFKPKKNKFKDYERKLKKK